MIPFLATAEAKLIAGAVAALALAGAVGYVVHHERAIGASAVTAAVADQHAKDVDAARAQEARITAVQQETDREADKFNLAAQLAAPRARSAADGLQQRFAAINASCVPSDPAASGGSAAASAAADLRADVLRRVADAALAAASAADAARAAGLRAQGRYDALTNSAAGSAP